MGMEGKWKLVILGGGGGILTCFGVRLGGVEPLEGGGRVVLYENHCVAGFVAGSDLDAS